MASACTLLTSTGGYSKRMFSPALTENLAAWSWIVGGIVHGLLHKSVKDKLPA